MKPSALGFGAKAVCALAAAAMLATPACAPIAHGEDGIAAARAPFDPGAPERTRVGDLVWRGSLHVEAPRSHADAQMRVVATGAEEIAVPVLAAVFADGSEIAAPLAFDRTGGLVGLKETGPDLLEGAAGAAALADAAADDADGDDAEALLIADAPSVSVAGDGRIWRCAEPDQSADRCRLIGKAPAPVAAHGAAFRLLCAERLSDRGAYTLLWSGRDTALRAEAIVTVFTPRHGDTPPSAGVLADLKAPLLPGQARGLSVFQGRQGPRIFILADEAAAPGGARLLSFDWVDVPPAKAAAPRGRPRSS